MIDFTRPLPPPVVPAPGAVDPATATPAAPDLSGLPLEAVLAALNHLLQQQGWARDKLRMFAGRRLRIGLDPASPLARLAPALHGRIGDDGFVRPTPASDPSGAAGEPRPDVTLLLKPSVAAVFDGLRGGPTELSRHLKVDGDVMLAATLGELAQHLRWDAEEDVSRVVGDIAARRLFAMLDRIRERVGAAGARARIGASQYLTVEDPLLVTPAAMRTLSDGLSALARELDRLDARAARLRR